MSRRAAYQSQSRRRSLRFLNNEYVIELRHAFRSILRKPGFAAAALLTIVLGVGANTAVYSVVHSVLLEPLPFRDPKSLVQVWETHPDLHNLQVSVPDYLDWRNSLTDLDLAAYTFEAMNKGTLLGQGEPYQVQATMASAELFRLLGIQPLLGRAFDVKEEQQKRPVALISERLWRLKFAADPRVIGRSLRLDTTSYTIAGVLSHRQALPAWADVWMPLSFLDPDMQSTRKYHPLEVIGRLRAGVSTEQAELQTETIARRLSAAYPATNGRIGAFLVPLLEEVTGEVRPALVAVWIAVTLVLLIACANLAHLMMARSIDRRHEIAVRRALGASRWGAVREFFFETLILSSAGGMLGICAAAGTLPVLYRMAQGRIPRLAASGLDAPALLFGLLISLAVAVLFALPACWQAGGGNANEVIGSGETRAASARCSRAGMVMMSSEVALSLAVSLAATMLVRSFAFTLATDPGFRPERVLAIDAPLAADWDKSYEMFRNRIEPALKSLPGVQAVAAVKSVPMSLGASEHSRFATRFGIVGRSFDSGKFPTAQIRWCTSGYFHAMEIPLKSGRLLVETDHNQPRYVINEPFARRFFPNQSAVGQKLLLDVVSAHPQTAEIVGVVGDVREFDLNTPPTPTMYSLDVSVRMNVLMKTAGNPVSLAHSAVEILRRVNPEGAIGPARTLGDYLESSLARQRFALALMGAFASLALALCAVGIYGVFGYSVSRRLREFGLRSAIGAQRKDLLAQVFRECLAVAIPGLAAGMALSLACSQYMRSLVSRLPQTDAPSYAMAGCLVLLLCMAAAVTPASRAAKADPASVLRQQ